MALPLLEYAPLSNNHRVNGFEVPGEEQPRIYTSDKIDSSIDSLITAAYRQIFNEQQMIASNRQKALESQLKSHQISVKDFIRGLALSDSFRRLVYNTNNNYRFAQICIQRILGRDVYSDREKLAWSVVIATKGVGGFIDDLVNTEEYSHNFGETTVPYQRRRILPQRSQGEIPFSQMARYDKYHLAQLPKPSWKGLSTIGAARLDYTRWDWQKNPSPALKAAGSVITIGGVAFIVLLFGATVLGF
jgi:phycobilisome rod-core linker protein